MTDLIQLILELSSRNVHMYVEEGRLNIDAPREASLDDIMPRIRLHKQALLQYLSSHRQSTNTGIPRAASKENYPLSSSQRRLWILAQMQGGNTAYNIAKVCLFRGHLDEEALNHAFDAVIGRHEILRTTFGENGSGELYQQVHTAAAYGFHIASKDLRAEDNAAETADSLLQGILSRPFNLSTGPLMRASLLRTSADEWVFVYVMHHIISDRWSMSILLKELLSLYVSFTEKKPHSFFTELPIQYKDYATWQQQQLADASMAVHKNYWLGQLQAPLPALDLPLDRNRPAVKSYRGHTIEGRISSPMAQKLKKLAHRQDATLFMTLLAAVNVLLYKISGQNDIIVGSPIAGREHADLNDQIGFYVNVLALRSRFSGEDSFTALLSNVRQVTLEAYEHQAYPFDELIDMLNIPRDMSRDALFDVFIDLQDAGTGIAAGGGEAALHVLPYEGGAAAMSKFDLTFMFTDTGEDILTGIEYNVDIFGEESIRRMLHHFVVLLHAITEDPSLQLSRLSLLDDAERTLLLHGFNHTDGTLYSYSSVIDLFSRQADKTPQATAVRYKDISLTYEELDEQSDRLAVYLKKASKINDNDPVGILLGRSDKMIVAVLGVLKAGACYVPMDPDHPAARKKYVVQDTRMKVLLTETDYLFELDFFEGEIFAMDVQLEILDASKERVNCMPAADDQAYVIYTSGSTGDPKGCVLTHGNLSHYIQWANNYYFPDLETVNFCLFTSLAFDLTVTSIFCTLTMGGSITVYPQQEDTARVLQDCFRDGSTINCIKLTPSHVNMLEHLPVTPGSSPVALAILGGEEVTQMQVRTLRRLNPRLKIYNEYGPTETTVGCIVKELHPDEPVLIGQPAPGVSVYILDKQDAPCPIGTPGEICVGGPGLAKCYLNKPELTGKKFVPDPFRPGKKMYRTGDLAKWLPDGEIAFLGRMDDQVKIRGFRIEPGEIVHALLLHNQVRDAVVMMRKDELGNKMLAAYYIPAGEVTGANLKDHLSVRLPAYMVPAFFIPMESFPLTSNGKIDRRQMPDPLGAGAGEHTAYIPPRTEVEKHLAEVFEEVLRRPAVGVQDNFFVLGGDSIKSIQVVSRMRQRGYAVGIQDVMFSPRISELAGKVTIISRIISQDLVKGPVELSPIQQWFFEHSGNTVHHFNQSVLLSGRNGFSEAGLRAALSRLILHHDALRTVFRRVEGRWMQEVLGEDQGFAWEVHWCGDEASYRAQCDRVQSGIDLSQGPLLKACLLRQHGESDRLLLVVHHLVIDGVSWRILLEDLQRLYAQWQQGEELALPAKTDPFQYYQTRQRQYAKNGLLRSEEVYWDKVVASASTAPGLPMDDPHGSNRAKDMDSCGFLLSEQLTGKLIHECYKPYRTEVMEILLASAAQAFSDVFAMDKMVLRMEGHGRETMGTDVDVSRTIGWFTTEYPVVLELKYGQDIVAQLLEVKQRLRKIPGKGIGYGILHYLREERPAHAHGDVSFNYLGDFGDGISGAEQEEWSISGAYQGRRIADEWPRAAVLGLTAVVGEGRLRLTIEYSREQYGAARVQQLANACQQHLTNLIMLLSQEQEEHSGPSDMSYKDLDMDQWQALREGGEIEDIYRLSPLQEGLYFHWVSGNAAGSYFEQTSYRLKGHVDPDIVKASFSMLIRRHAILRTFFWQDGEGAVLQIVRKEVEEPFAYHDLRMEGADAVQAHLRADRASGFHLHEGSQMRLTLLRASEDEYVFIWSHHHILMDGWCGGLLIREFAQIYDGLVNGVRPALGKLYPYVKYIEWLEKLDRQASLDHWRAYLDGYEVVTGIPRLASARANEAAATKTEKKIFKIEQGLRAKIRDLCRSQGITENIFMQAAWGLLLGFYNQSEDVLFGAVVSGRPGELEGVENIIGLFVNTIPVRIRFEKDTKVSELLRQAQVSAIEGTPHHYMQLAEVQALTSLGSGLFDHLLIFENYPIQEMLGQQLGGNSEELKLLSAEVTGRTNYPLSVLVIPRDEISVEITYDGLLYEDGQIHRLWDHWLRIMGQMTEEEDMAIGRMDYVGAEERRLLLDTFCRTERPYPKEACVTDLVERQAAACPGTIAIRYGADQLTYEELDRQAALLGRKISLDHGVRKGDRVGLVLRRDLRSSIAILAIWKAGACCVPLDPSYPDERKTYMLADSGCRLVLDEAWWEQNSNDAGIHGEDSVVSPGQLTGDDLAFIIYTSGSTGRPKGCMLRHRGIVNHIFSKIGLLGLTAGTWWCHTSALHFVGGIWQLWAPLTVGASVMLCDDEELADLNALLHRAAELGVDMLEVIPSQVGEFLSSGEMPDMTGLRKLILTGEKLRPELLRRCHAAFPQLAIINTYGQTESSDVTASWVVRPEAVERGIILAGSPTQNMRHYVLADTGRPCGIGITGELYTSGDGVCAGYINDEPRSREKFPANPYEHNAPMHRTGDLARWRDNGELEVVGRRDEQIKIRGFRIGPGEIEEVLSSYPGITSAVVVADEIKGRLTGFVAGAGSPDWEDLRDYVSHRLPDHMRPSRFIWLSHLPLLPNGKVDRKTLRERAEREKEDTLEYEPPRTDVEQRLAVLWEQLLQREKIGIKENFFHLGGHSLKATRLIAMIYKEFEVRIRLTTIFQRPTIESIAEEIEKTYWTSNELFGIDDTEKITI